MEENEDISNRTVYVNEHELLRLENFFIKLYLDVSLCLIYTFCEASII